MDKNIFTELKIEYPFLTKVEKKIADFILNSPQEFTELSMPELSRLCDISQGSINNFSKKFSSGGFPSLKLKIARSPAVYSDNIPSAQTANSIKSVMNNIIERYSDALKNTLEANDEENLLSCAQKIVNAQKIEVYGFYQSAIVARDISHQLIQLGIPATYIGDHFMCAVSASLLTDDCLVIAVSSSGMTKEVIDCIEIAKRDEVPVIGITANKTSPLAKLSDNCLLAVKSGTSVESNPAETRTSELYIMDSLCEYIKKLACNGENRQKEKITEIFNSHNVYD